MDAAGRFDEVFRSAPLPGESVSKRIMVALEFVMELQKKGLCNDYGCVSWSEKDGVHLTAPCPRIPFAQDQQSDASSQKASL